MESFFRSNYDSARELFIKSAKAAGAELLSYPVSNDLSVDVAVVKGSCQSDRYLLHISGTHGVEGYVGSAIQSCMLSYLQTQMLQNKPIKTTIVFVHILNPFGMKYNRRVNEDNIDLNRNFLLEEDFQRVCTRDPNFAGYVDLDSLLNPVSSVLPLTPTFQILNTAYALLKTVGAVLRYGVFKIKRALVSGNYYKQRGLGYGGERLSNSAIALIKVVNDLGLGRGTVSQPGTRRQVVLIDAHSGLGPCGQDTLDASPKAQDLEAVFPTEFETTSTFFGGSVKKAVGGLKMATKAAGGGALDGYDLTEGTVNGFFPSKFLAEDIDGLYMIQEFGTIPAPLVGQALMAENMAWFHGNAYAKDYYGNVLKKAFYLEHDTRWKRSVVRRGMAVVLQALRHLGDDHLDD